MGLSRLLSARGALVVRRRRPLSAVVVVVLVLLSAWCVAYELADTLVPAWGSWFAFSGVGPDVLFAVAGLLLIVRGAGGERGWLLIGAGVGCWAAGDIYWTVALSSLGSTPVPSWADAGYLLFCPLVFAGILSLVRQRVSGAPRTLVVDALAAALAVGALSAAVAMQPVLTHTQGGSLAVATNLAYPLSDLLLLGLVVGATALGDWRLERTGLLLAASIVVFWIADSAYLVSSASGTYQEGAWYEPLWYWCPVLAAGAAWLPRRALAVGREGLPKARGIVMPLGFAAVALVILVWSSFDPVGVVAVVLATSSLVVVMCRLGLTWREHSRLLRSSQDEAMTDALTGLPNRRALTVELERRIARSGSERPFMLVMFDLDGFKGYNDQYGHPAGDALLQRLAGKLASHLQGIGTAYRMGGDEFCALIDLPAHGSQAEAQAAAEALSEHGDGLRSAPRTGRSCCPQRRRRAPTR